MSVILTKRLKLERYSSLCNCLPFLAEYSQSSTKISPKLRNNFIYKRKFQELKDNFQQKLMPSTDLLSTQERFNNRKTKDLNFSPLQYRGEILYGIHPVYLALLEKRRTLFQLFLRVDKEVPNSKEYVDRKNAAQKSQIAEMAESLNVSISFIDTKGMKYLAPGAVHQGVCMDVSPIPLLDCQEAITQEDSGLPLWLILDGLLDPMNVGAIIRSAHYFGVSRLFLSSNSCKLSPTVSKASSGAMEIMKIHQILHLKEFIEIKRAENWDIISTVAYCEDDDSCHGSIVDIADLEVSKPTIFILGNEGKGISPDIQELCNTFVSITPNHTLHEGIDSLNVSVAAGVLLHSLGKKLKVKR